MSERELDEQRDFAHRGRVSAPERIRRRRALETLMEQEGLAALVIYGRGEPKHRGRVFYASDVWQFAGDAFVVLSPTDDAFFVNTPLVGLDEAKTSDWVQDLRMAAEPGALIGRELLAREVGGGVIGVAGWSDGLPLAYAQQLQSTLPDAELRDVTEEFDRVRQVKSPEELGSLHETSAALRAVFDGLTPEIQPGAQTREILAHAAKLARLHGCIDVMAYMATSPFGSYTFGGADQVSRESSIVVWLECSGPSGYWLELNACYSFGEPSESARRAWAIQSQSFDAALQVMRPGASPSVILSAVSEVYRANGFEPPEANSTYLAHGIGTDTVEGFWLPGNDRILAEDEVLSLHPFMRFDDPAEAGEMAYISVTDNVRVTPNGGQRMTYDSASWIEL